MADIIIVNSDIRTCDPAKPRARALAIRGTKFVGVGTEDRIRSQFLAPFTKVIDFENRTVIPGLVDAHVHLRDGSILFEGGVDLFEVYDVKKWKLRIEEVGSRTPRDGTWLQGGRWDMNELDPGISLPSLAEIDAILPDVPMALNDIDYHSLWINKCAMDKIGIDENTTSPPGGEICRDPRTGELTGQLKETAQQLVWDSPSFTESPQANMSLSAFHRVVKHFNSLGVTGAHDIVRDSQLYERLLRDDRFFPLRVWFGRWMSPHDSLDDIVEERSRLNELAAKYEAHFKQGVSVRHGFIKYFADGTLAYYTAALQDPYSDRPNFRGEPQFEARSLCHAVNAAHSRGFGVAIHAIGDRAVNMALDAFADNPELRPSGAVDRIEHIECLAPTDVPRFAKGSIVASMQPNHCCAGSYQEARLGDSRLPLSYAWQTLLSSGAKLVLGSDWPTARESPLQHISDAVRRERHGKPFYPANSLALDEALFAHTRAAADVAGFGADVGSITVGKYADFAVLPHKLDEVGRQQIENWSIFQTWFAGTLVYVADSTMADKPSSINLSGLGLC